MDRPKKKRRVDGGVASSNADTSSVTSIAQLFGAEKSSSKAPLSSTFGRLFSSAAAASSGGGGGVSSVLSGTSSSSTAPAKSNAAAEAAAKAAAKLLKKPKSSDADAVNADAGKDGSVKSKKASWAMSPATKMQLDAQASNKKANKGIQLTPEQRKEQDARTLFVGNVPLSWEKKKLRDALRKAVPSEKYDGAFKPIWFRGEPLKEEYKNNTMRKVGSMRGAYAKHVSDAKIAYILLESAADVKAVKHAAENLLADKDHILRLDAVGESATTQFDRKRSVFVGNLPSDTTEADLRRVFKDVGDVDAVRIVRDKYASQACKGIAFVRFKDRSSVKPALDLWGTELRWRTIRVMKIEKPEDDEEKTSKRLQDDADHPAARRQQHQQQKIMRNRTRKATRDAKEVGMSKKSDKKKKAGKKDGGKVKVRSFETKKKH